MRTQKYSLAWFFALWLMSGWIVVSLAQASGLEQAQVQTLSSYSRIVIPVTTGSKFQVDQEEGRVSLQIDRVKISALASLSSLQDSRITGVRVKKQGLDSVVLEVGLRGQGQEFFAYSQNSPPAVLLDVWEKTPAKQLDNRTIASVEGKKAPTRSVATKTVVQNKKARTLASLSPLKAQEYEPELSVELLRFGQDIFERFPLPMPALTVSSKKFPVPVTLDMNALWTFTNPVGKGPEAQAFALAQRLFKEKKYGLAIRATELSERDSPNSVYVPEMRFLRAMALRKLGEQNASDALVKKAETDLMELGALKAGGNSLPFATAIRFFFAAKAYKEERWFDALSDLEYLAQAIGNKDPDFSSLQLTMADLYGKVKEPRRAERLYRYLVEHHGKEINAKEAAYRKADLLASEKNYRRTVEEAEAALERYPEYAKQRSETVFNLAEAYFWLGSFKKSEENFQRFLKINPSATIGSLALVRLGEIAEIARKDAKEAEQFYQKARNSYPFSAGDRIATVRLARLLLKEEKDTAYQIQALEKVRDHKDIGFDTKRFTDLALIDYSLKAGEVDKAISIARTGMADTEGPVYEGYKNGLVKGLFFKAVALNKAGKFSETVALYDKEKSWMQQYGSEVYRVLADAYRGLNLFASSNTYMEQYLGEKRKSGRSLAGVDESARLAKARNSFAQGNFADALQQMGNREDSLEALRLRAVSQFRLQRFIDSYDLAEKAVDAMEVNRAGGVKENYDELVADFAEIFMYRGSASRNYGEETESLAKLRKLASEKKENLEFAYADALWNGKQHGQAIEAYKAAIENFPKSERIDRAKYQIGMSYLALGKKAEAVKTLTELRDKSQTLWAQSAKQELELIEWEKKYSSVLRGLPPQGLGWGN